MKRNNWNLLQKKVFIKLDFVVPPTLIEHIIIAKPFAIEFFLLKLKDVLKYRKVDKPKINKNFYEATGKVVRKG